MILQGRLVEDKIFFVDMNEHTIFSIPYSHYESYFYQFDSELLKRAKELLQQRYEVVFNTEEYEIYYPHVEQNDVISQVLSKVSEMEFQDKTPFDEAQEMAEDIMSSKRISNYDILENEIDLYKK